MNCKHCGIADIPEYAVFCPACGKKLLSEKQLVTPRLRLNAKNDGVLVQASSWWFKSLNSKTNCDFLLSLEPDLARGFRIYNGNNLIAIDFTHFVPAPNFNLCYTFKDCTEIKRIDLQPLGSVKIAASINEMFKNCRELTDINPGTLDMSEVVSAESTFDGCASLACLDISTWTLSKLGVAQNMFRGCTALKSVEFSREGLPEITNCSQMFCNCSSLTELDLSMLKLWRVRDISMMFSGCSKLRRLNLSGADFSAVTSQNRAFSGCKCLSEVIMYGCNNRTVDIVDVLLRDAGLTGVRIVR